MKISKVRVFEYEIETNDVWTESEQPSQRTIKFLTGIYPTDYFQKHIAVYRHFFGLPKDGFNENITKKR